MNEYGSIEGILYIIEDNPEDNLLSFPARPTNKFSLLIRNDAVINKRVKDHLAANFPNTGNHFQFLIPGSKEEFGEAPEDFGGLIKIIYYE